MHSAWRPWSGSSKMDRCGREDVRVPACAPERFTGHDHNIRRRRSQWTPSLRHRPAAANGSLVWKLVGVCLIAGLSGFNAWWYWRDTRPLPDLNTISDWISQERYLEAEPALREHLRRSPHDGEARMMLAQALAGRGDLLACASQLHEVPYWSPRKAEALYREGQSYFEIDRAKDAEAAWLELIKDDPLHPVPPEIFHDACQALLKLYAIEDRWEDAYPVMWTAYDHAAPIDRPVLLAMRMRPELERIAPKESIGVLRALRRRRGRRLGGAPRPGPRQGGAGPVRRGRASLSGLS